MIDPNVQLVANSIRDELQHLQMRRVALMRNFPHSEWFSQMFETIVTVPKAHDKLKCVNVVH